MRRPKSSVFQAFIRAILIAAVFVAGCAARPPDDPPSYTEPPVVATDGFVTAFASEVFPMSLEGLRAFMLEESLIDYLEPVGSIANPASGEVLRGEWPNVDAVRRLQLTDGHYVIERVLENEPTVFRYQLWVFTNDVGRGVSQIVGEQRFTEVDGGTRFDWYYNMAPRNGFTRIFVKRACKREVQPYLAGGLRRYAEAAARATAPDQAPASGETPNK